jgi:peptidoglycan/LPS O-acetylase OafA/YrhL
MFFVVCSTAGVQYLLRNGKMPMGTGNNMLNALLYMANFEPFGPHSESVWKNTYSMANQEQWYLGWSLCLPFLLGLSRRTRNSIIITTIVLSFSGRFAFAMGLTDSALFRWDGFLGWIGKLQVGALLRLSSIPRWMQSSRMVWVGFAFSALLWIDASYDVDTKMRTLGLDMRYLNQTIYTQIIALCAATSLVVGSIQGFALFELQLLRFLGRISYSWFLFQVPLLRIAGSPKFYNAIAHSCIAFVAAMFSTFYIEEPIRDWNKNRRKTSAKAAGS